DGEWGKFGPRFCAGQFFVERFPVDAEVGMQLADLLLQGFHLIMQVFGALDQFLDIVHPRSPSPAPGAWFWTWGIIRDKHRSANFPCQSWHVRRSGRPDGNRIPRAKKTRGPACPRVLQETPRAQESSPCLDLAFRRREDTSTRTLTPVALTLF